MINFKRKILIIITTVLAVMLIMIPNKVHATDTSINVITPSGTTTSSTTPTPTVTTTPTTATSSTPKATATATTSSTLPQTGIEDYTGLIIAIVLLTGSAMFAYTKIRKYNKF